MSALLWYRWQLLTALQYGGAHEHKGPEDFMGKKDADDDDDHLDIDLPYFM